MIFVRKGKLMDYKYYSTVRIRVSLMPNYTLLFIALKNEGTILRDFDRKICHFLCTTHITIFVTFLATLFFKISHEKIKAFFNFRKNSIVY